MKRVDTDLLLFQHTLDSTQLTSTFTEARFTTGAVAVTAKMALGAMASASGSLLGADQSTLTSPNLAITSFAIARCQLTLPSAMALTSTCSSG